MLSEQKQQSHFGEFKQLNNDLQSIDSFSYLNFLDFLGMYKCTHRAFCGLVISAAFKQISLNFLCD